jgi:hypothetical protein
MISLAVFMDAEMSVGLGTGTCYKRGLSGRHKTVRSSATPPKSPARWRVFGAATDHLPIRSEG